jgi:DNA-directed RNA polymerase beta subunit
MAAQDNLSASLFTVPVYRGLGGTHEVKKPLGMHWSSKSSVASNFSELSIPRLPGDVTKSVVLVGKVHPAAIIDPKTKEGRKAVKENAIWPESNEKEVTVRPGAAVLVDRQFRKTAKKYKDEQGLTQVKLRARNRTFNPPRVMPA